MERISTNPRINSVLHGNYCNVEYTLPCAVKPIAEIDAERKAGIAGLEQILESGKRMIVPPETIARLSDGMREKLTVMASPSQCGRLLEADPEVEILGEPSVISFKGVGATSFAVRARVSYWLEKLDKLVVNDEEKNRQVNKEREEFLLISEALKNRRFSSFQELGLLDIRKATQEAMTNAHFDKLGAHAQRSLAIYQVEGLPDIDGEIKEVNYFKKIGCIPEDLHPAILVRSMRTNFRIMDLVSLKMSNQGIALERVVNHLCEREKEGKGQFLMRVLEKMAVNELMLILEGYQIGNPFWPIHARNISCEGEEIDLEDMKKNEKPEIEQNYSWAQVGRALIYGVAPGFYINNQRKIDGRIMVIIEETVKTSNLPKSKKKAAISTFWKQWRDSENTIFASMLKLVNEVAIST